jgi:nudix-type nucleoside diphosphatase (YffH/AdpP family)
MQNPDITIINTEILSDDWYTLNKVTYSLRKQNGKTETHSREAYDRGNGAAILLYNKTSGKVILTRQFRLPTYINGNPTGLLIEACAGLLDDNDPEDCVKREAEEETGYKISKLQKVLEAYTSPGSVTEILHLFIAEYTPEMRVGRGGGLVEEGEDIEVLEIGLDDALTMLDKGEIRDAKTIMLLQYLRLKGIM